MVNKSTRPHEHHSTFSSHGRTDTTHNCQCKKTRSQERNSTSNVWLIEWSPMNTIGALLKGARSRVPHKAAQTQQKTANARNPRSKNKFHMVAFCSSSEAPWTQLVHFQRGLVHECLPKTLKYSTQLPTNVQRLSKWSNSIWFIPYLVENSIFDMESTYLDPIFRQIRWIV